MYFLFFFFSSRRRHTRYWRDWSSDVCSSDLDLCEFHAERLTVPRGWEVVRHEIDVEDSGPTGDDLLALADAVREAARPEPPRNPADDGSGTRRGHLRVLPDIT